MNQHESKDLFDIDASERRLDKTLSVVGMILIVAAVLVATCAA